MSEKKQIVLHHRPSVELPKDAYEIHYLLACSVIRTELYVTGLIARQDTFWVTRDSVYAKMKDSDLYYEINLEIVTV